MAQKRIPAQLPEWFDQNDPGHMRAAQKVVTDKLGDGWDLRAVDVGAGFVLAERHQGVSEVVSRDKNSVRVVVAPGTSPSDGQKFEERMQGMFPGYTLTDFRPFREEATLTKLDPATLHARDTIATATGIRFPWEIKIRPVAGGGFDVKLPNNRYKPGLHDQKIRDAATTTIGEPGWYVVFDRNKLLAKIRPGELPTFDPMVPYPISRKAGPRDLWKLPVGVTLADPGVEASRELLIDMEDRPGTLVSGTAGSGKSVSINEIIFGTLIRGWDLALITEPNKAVDFDMWKPYVKDHWWGCDSHEQALAVVSMVYEEGKRRGELLRKHGAKKIQNIKAGDRPKPVLLVMDELAALFHTESLPKGLPKDNEVVVELMESNAISSMIKSKATKIPAELRAAGIRVTYSTQMAQANTGVSVPLKTNLANRVLFGSKPTKIERGHALLNPDIVPEIPDHIRDDDLASKGCGVAEFEGQPAKVFKGYFASDEDLLAEVARRGVPTTNKPEPTRAQINRYLPTTDSEFADDGPPASKINSGGFGQKDGRDIAAGDKLQGAAKAAHESRLIAAGVDPTMF